MHYAQEFLLTLSPNGLYNAIRAVWLNVGLIRVLTGSVRG